jgi:parallel beta-helix repeat protein
MMKFSAGHLVSNAAKKVGTTTCFSCLVAFSLIFAPGTASAISVTDCGANGFDTIDDTEAFNNCLKSNADVSIPGGIYYISATITDTGITGPGITVPGGSQFYGVGSSAAAVVLKLNGDFVGLEIHENSYVHDFTLDRVTPNNTKAAVLVDKDNVIVDRLHILDNRSTAAAVMVTGKNNVHLRWNYIRNYQRWDGSQVRGVGIRASDSTNVYIKYNTIQSLQTFPVGLGNYYQAAGIEISNTTGPLTEVEGNIIEKTGNCIDAGEAENATIQGNDLDNCHEAGIKLVNGAGGNTVRWNQISRTGLAGIWLTPGSPCEVGVPCSKGPIHHNTIHENQVDKIGEGIGAGSWAEASLRPAGILLDGDFEAWENVSRYNVVTGNEVCMGAAAQAAIIENTSQQFDPEQNAFSNNVTYTSHCPF